MEEKLSVIGWITRIASLFAAVFFFFPFCTVSCSGQTVDVTGKDITFGVSFGSEYQSDGYIYFILLLLVPVLIFVLSFLKSASVQIAMIVGSVIDLFLMIDFVGKLREEVEKLLCTAEYSATFYFNVICHILIIGCAVCFLYFNKSDKSGTDVNELQRKTPDQDRIYIGGQNQTTQMKPAVRIFCTKCGEPLKKGAVFCTRCGSKVN